MNRLKEHITIEELVALFDGNLELLPKMLEHIKNCDSCSNELEKYESMIGFVSSNRDISHFPDMEKIEIIASNSFKLLHADPKETAEPETEHRQRSFFDIIFSFLKPLSIAGAVAALVAVLIYTGIDKEENEKAEDSFAFKDVEDSQGDNINEKETVIEPATVKKGTVLKTERVEIKVLADTFIGTISKDEVVMKNGKASFDVVRSDKDFKVEVLNRFTVRVLGTAFTIESDKSGVHVFVERGLVEIIDIKNNSNTVLTAKMDKTFKFESKKVKLEKAVVQKPVKITPQLKEESSKLVVTPEASFLQQGREALESGRKGAAIQLFIMELEKGKEKDKALFEISRIHSNENKNLEVIKTLKENKDVLNSSKLYKEELLIRGCHAQHRSDNGDTSFCRQYLKEFPRGYKRSEIEGLINE
jgi:hypothetical protein